VPSAIAGRDRRSTEAGYPSAKRRNIIVAALAERQATHDVERGRSGGIVYIDADRQDISRKSDNSEQSRATFREGVQQALLKNQSEGTVGQTFAEGRGLGKHPQQDFLQVDTTNILFNLAAARSWARSSSSGAWGQAALGLRQPDIKSKKEFKARRAAREGQPEDLLKFGPSPSSNGRSVLATCTSSTKEARRRHPERSRRPSLAKAVPESSSSGRG